MSYALLSRCFIQRQHHKNTVVMEQNSLAYWLQLFRGGMDEGIDGEWLL